MYDLRHVLCGTRVQTSGSLLGSTLGHIGFLITHVQTIICQVCRCVCVWARVPYCLFPTSTICEYENQTLRTSLKPLDSDVLSHSKTLGQLPNLKQFQSFVDSTSSPEAGLRYFQEELAIILEFSRQEVVQSQSVPRSFMI